MKKSGSQGKQAATILGTVGRVENKIVRFRCYFYFILVGLNFVKIWV